MYTLSLPYDNKDAIKAYKEVFRVKRMNAKESKMFKDRFMGKFDSVENFCIWYLDQVENFEETDIKEYASSLFDYGNACYSQDGYVFL